MTRILQIPNYQYPHIGGIEQTSRDISNVLSKIPNVSHMTICFNEDARDNDYICRRRETRKDIVDDYEVIRCGCITKVASQSISLTYPQKLSEVMKEFKPDVVIFHYPNPYVAAILLPLLSPKCELVLYWHLDIVKQRVLGKLFWGQTNRLCKRARAIVATSPNYVDGSRFLSRYREKITIIPNCIRTEKMNEIYSTNEKAKAIRNKYEGKTICFALGRHVPYKGMEYLIKASRKLDDSVVILIGGSGELTGSLKEMAGDDSKLIFLGRIANEDLAAYYKASDIFCFPSVTKNEAFGLALAEAMYYGKPAITFTIPGSGVNYVSVNGLTGIECENRNFDEFADAIIKLSEDKELRNRLGKNAEERSKSLFLFEQFECNIRKFINKMKLE